MLLASDSKWGDNFQQQWSLGFNTRCVVLVLFSIRYEVSVFWESPHSVSIYISQDVPNFCNWGGRKVLFNTHFDFKKCISSNSTPIILHVNSLDGLLYLVSWKIWKSTHRCSVNYESVNFFSHMGLISPLAFGITHIHTHFFILNLLFV